MKKTLLNILEILLIAVALVCSVLLVKGCFEKNKKPKSVVVITKSTTVPRKEENKETELKVPKIVECKVVIKKKYKVGAPIQAPKITNQMVSKTIIEESIKETLDNDFNFSIISIWPEHRR